jgi:hypothetical protein
LSLPWGAVGAVDGGSFRSLDSRLGGKLVVNRSLWSLQGWRGGGGYLKVVVVKKCVLYGRSQESESRIRRRIVSLLKEETRAVSAGGGICSPFLSLLVLASYYCVGLDCCRSPNQAGSFKDSSPNGGQPMTICSPNMIATIPVGLLNQSRVVN